MLSNVSSSGPLPFVKLDVRAISELALKVGILDSDLRGTSKRVDRIEAKVYNGNGARKS